MADVNPEFLMIAPMASEHATVRRALGARLTAGGWALGACGIGPDRSGAFCLGLDEDALPRLVALVGWAGGVSADLKVGDWVVASAALFEDRESVPCAVVPIARAHVGPVLTARKALTTYAQKHAAQDTGAIAVEMEAYPLAAWARDHDIPFVHARIILDALGDPLPEMGGALDGRGHPERMAFLRALFRRPRRLIAFGGLAVRMLRLNRQLARLAQAVAESCEEMMAAR